MTQSESVFDPIIIDTGTPCEVMNAYGNFCKMTYAPNPMPYVSKDEYPFDDEYPFTEDNNVFDDYIKRCDEYDNAQHRLREHQMLALHCVLGLVGEVQELDQLPETNKNPMPFTKNVCEEMGDIAYYICVYAKLRNLVWSPLDLPENSIELIKSTNPMVGIDLVKRFVFYQNEAYGLHIDKYFKTIGYALIRGTFDSMPVDNFRTVFRHNYHKLKARYDKMVFTKEDAAQRKDKVNDDDNPTI